MIIVIVTSYSSSQFQKYPSCFSAEFGPGLVLGGVILFWRDLARKGNKNDAEYQIANNSHNS